MSWTPLIRAGGLVLGALLLGPRPALASARAVAKERVALRAEAHEILGAYCGKCHDSKLPTAKPSALAVFDLAQADWADRLTGERLEHILGRMESFGVPEPSRVRLRAFVAAEKRARP